MSKTIIFILAIFFTNLAFAKQKTIKFHKPETEAERALDRILGNVFELTDENKDMFTAEFIKDYNRQSCVGVLNIKECMKDWSYDSYPWDANAISCSQDSPYGYAKDPYDELFRATNCKNLSNECYIKMITGVYYMKKEKGKWRVDGISCNPDGYISINLQQ
jgi:hypothetical protein